MDSVFPAGHGLLTAGDLPSAELDTQLAHTRLKLFSIHAGPPRWLDDGMSVELTSHKPTYGQRDPSAVHSRI